LKAREARKAREMLLTAVLGLLQPGHLGRLCRRQKRQSGGWLKRPGRLGERSGRLWRCGGRERSCGIVTGRRETVCTRVTRKVTESASPRAATRLSRLAELCMRPRETGVDDPTTRRVTRHETDESLDRDVRRDDRAYRDAAPTRRAREKPRTGAEERGAVRGPDEKKNGYRYSIFRVPIISTW
jgi:hypothetical protein